MWEQAIMDAVENQAEYRSISDEVSSHHGREALRVGRKQ